MSETDPVVQVVPDEPCCPTCGSTDAKRWKTLDGQEVCDECVMDVMMDRQRTWYNRARSNAVTLPNYSRREPKTLPRKSESPNLIRHKSAGTNPTSGTTGSLRGGGLDFLGRTLGSPTHAQCLNCGRLWWGSTRERCKRCGGLCVPRTTHDLELMQRYPTFHVESEK
jgi:hypothetical protein